MRARLMIWGAGLLNVAGVCCSVLQCVAARCSVLQCVTRYSYRLMIVHHSLLNVAVGYLPYTAVLVCVCDEVEKSHGGDLFESLHGIPGRLQVNQESST